MCRCAVAASVRRLRVKKNKPWEQTRKRPGTSVLTEHREIERSNGPLHQIVYFSSPALPGIFYGYDGSVYMSALPEPEPFVPELGIDPEGRLRFGGGDEDYVLGPCPFADVLAESPGHAWLSCVDGSVCELSWEPGNVSESMVLRPHPSPLSYPAPPPSNPFTAAMRSAAAWYSRDERFPRTHYVDPNADRCMRCGMTGRQMALAGFPVCR